MVDFSYLKRQWPTLVARDYESGKTPTDEALLEAFGVASELDMAEPDRRAIRRILSRSRGRPSKAEKSREDLAAAILASEREGIPRGFLDALANRITSKRGLTELQRALPFYRQRMSNDREFMIVRLYRDTYDLLDGSDTVEHPILGQMGTRRS